MTDQPSPDSESGAPLRLMMIFAVAAFVGCGASGRTHTATIPMTTPPPAVCPSGQHHAFDMPSERCVVNP